MKKQTQILLVEDRRGARNTVKGMLRGLKYEIDEAQSGELALEKLADTDYDAIILDLGLPGINGIEMLRKAQRLRPILPPVVVLTRHYDAEHAFDAGKISVFRFVAKSQLKADSFKEIIVSAVNHKHDLSVVNVKRCFKHNKFGCNISFKLPRRFVFVGIPFRMNAVYRQGIRPVVESFKMNCGRADDLPKTGDFTCKLCGMIQASRLALFDISTLNANVLMELGFALGRGKEVIILTQKTLKLPVNLGAFEVVQYSTIADLRKKLARYLESF